MTLRGLRLLRVGLVGVVLLITVSVALSLRRPQPARPAAAQGATEAPPPGGTRLGGFEYRQLKQGREAFVLKAQSMVGREGQEVHLGGVTMTFPYMARGEQGTATVTAEACDYTPAIQKAAFQGNVVVKTEDGLELTTDSLVYRGDKGVARTEAPVQFRRKELSGRSTGMLYQAEDGRLELMADAFLRIANENEPPLEIRSRKAETAKDEGTLKFVDDVEARQGPDSLEASQLLVTFSPEDRSLVGFTASGDVELRMPGGSSLPGTGVMGSGKGPTVLKSQRLDVSFRKDRSPEAATAGPDAELTMLPGPGEPREQRRVRAKYLTFRFDEQRRLQEVQGQKDSVLVQEPVAPAKGVELTIACRSFVALLEPQTGQTKSVEFRRDVEMTRGTQKATAERAWYEGPDSLLSLDDGPELKDLDDGSRLQARHIGIKTLTGDLEARGDVQHVLARKAGMKRPGLLGSEEAPTLVTCALFGHESRSKETRYREGALLRSGRDEIRAPAIEVTEDKAGARRLTAGEGVVSLFHPRERPGQKAPAAVETRAKQLVYEETKRKALYTGDVVIRQGDMVTRSPEATVTLTPDGGAVETVVAGTPVDIQQGVRTASGERGTYTPATETLVIVGEKVLLKDPPQEVQGRSLTFHVGDDTILVDGREWARTNTIIKKETPKP